MCGDRLVELALRSQYDPEVGMGPSEVGLDPDRAPGVFFAKGAETVA